MSEVKAKTICNMRRNYKPWLKADGTIQDTNFADNLQVIIVARVMLIYNDEYVKIDKTDELVNKIKKCQSVQVWVTLKDLAVFKPRDEPGLILAFG